MTTPARGLRNHEHHQGPGWLLLLALLVVTGGGLAFLWAGRLDGRPAADAPLPPASAQGPEFEPSSTAPETTPPLPPERVSERQEALPSVALLWDSEAPVDRNGVGEDEHLEHYLRRAAEDPEAFDKHAERLLVQATAECRQRAILRAALELRPETARDLFHAVFEGRVSEDAMRTIALTTFAVRHLSSRCVDEPRARELLAQRLWSETAPLQAELRRRGALHLTPTIDDTELASLTPGLLAEGDPAVRAAATQGLRRNARAANARELAKLLGAEQEPVERTDDGGG